MLIPTGNRQAQAAQPKTSKSSCQGYNAGMQCKQGGEAEESLLEDV